MLRKGIPYRFCDGLAMVLSVLDRVSNASRSNNRSKLPSDDLERSRVEQVVSMRQHPSSLLFGRKQTEKGVFIFFYLPSW